MASMSESGGRLSWRDAVRDALRRMHLETGRLEFSRKEILEQELGRIVQETGSTGRTPGQTLSRVAQELRDEGVLEFVSKGA